MAKSINSTDFYFKVKKNSEPECMCEKSVFLQPE